ncbi:MAG: UTP--glucose-1-phosphate uridylyltransferase, partial [Nitrospinales bacterium]
ETDKIIGKYKGDLRIVSFQQNKYPRLTKESHKPLDENKFGREAWYPPGHGDFYQSLLQQGLLDKLLDDGIEIIFVANADNLGAVVDCRIPRHMLDRDVPFVMEMTRKTLADVKGGTLYLDQDGHLKLLELARVPEDRVEEFCSLEKFQYFNTNNIWINLRHLKRRLDEGPLDLDVIVNHKQVDGVEARRKSSNTNRKTLPVVSKLALREGVDVIQLETAIGSALGCFSGAVGLIVNRDRFMPVKKTSDLLLVQSDLFILDEKGFLLRNPARTSADLPQVEFGDSFRKLEDFQERISAIPSLINLQKLVLDGDVWLESDVTLKGNVTLVSRNGRLTISKGTVVDNEALNR